MNRIDTTFQQCRKDNRKALVMFVSAGDPSLTATEALIPAIAAAGADIIEIGVPFSDPMADGTTIQEASQRALTAGTTLPGIIEMVRRVRHQTDAALVLFSYYNVVLQYGVEALARDSAEAGIDGWLLVDVPAEEADEVKPALDENDLRLVTLVAPTTAADRARDLIAKASGFVYYITVTGVTGARQALPARLAEDLAQLRAGQSIPIVAGFGISSGAMAREIGAHADGVVVGSALIQKMNAAPTVDQGIRDAETFVRELAAALR
mgnify:CR=1 FL=1